jgi:hypothetical protein
VPLVPPYHGPTSRAVARRCLVVERILTSLARGECLERRVRKWGLETPGDRCCQPPNRWPGKAQSRGLAVLLHRTRRVSKGLAVAGTLPSLVVPAFRKSWRELEMKLASFVVDAAADAARCWQQARSLQILLCALQFRLGSLSHLLQLVYFPQPSNEWPSQVGQTAVPIEPSDFVPVSAFYVNKYGAA